MVEPFRLIPALRWCAERVKSAGEREAAGTQPDFGGSLP